MSNIAISVRNLTKTYKLYQQPKDRLKEALHPLKKSYHKNFNALDGVTFEINRGESVGIIGRNGSGKSTLLKLITNVLTPTSGSAIVHGRVSAILELGAGFNGEMTGLENIYLNNIINSIPEPETKKQVDQIVKFAELGDFIHQPLKTYSSGMKARLAFALAINMHPNILIIDEALSVGDAAFQRKCFAKMEQIRKSGATILFVSHSETSILSFCNRVIWIANGTKVLDGNPKLVTSLYLKHINKPIKTDLIRQEYEGLVLPVSENPEIPLVNHSKVINDKSINHIVSGKEDIDLSSFNPNLKSTSIIEYEQKGAQIVNAKVTDLKGNEVNILEHGKQYYFNYRVKISHPLYQVKLGFLLKQKNGQAIGGGVYPSMMENIEQIKNNIKVKFKIKINMAAGEYFFNAGIQAQLNEKYDYAHRILDVCMVKVVNQPPNMTGIVKIIDESEFEKWK